MPDPQIVQIAQGLPGEGTDLGVMTLALQLGDHHQRQDHIVLTEAEERGRIRQQDGSVEHIAAPWRGAGWGALLTAGRGGAAAGAWAGNLGTGGLGVRGSNRAGLTGTGGGIGLGHEPAPADVHLDARGPHPSDAHVVGCRPRLCFGPRADGKSPCHNVNANRTMPAKTRCADQKMQLALRSQAR